MFGPILVHTVNPHLARQVYETVLRDCPRDQAGGTVTLATAETVQWQNLAIKRTGAVPPDQ